jgi:transposase-like protein
VCVEDITEVLWGTKVSPGTISNLNKKAYEHIKTWRCRKLTGSYPYVFVDGVYLKRSWGGEIQNVSILVAIGVNEYGCREIIGAVEGMTCACTCYVRWYFTAACGLKEDREGWRTFFVWLRERGLAGVRLIIGDKCLGMLESIPEVFPDAKYQRCSVYFYRKIFSVTPRNKMKEVSMLLKAIHTQECKTSAKEKAKQVADKLREMKLTSAAKKLEDGIEETITYIEFPSQHWIRIRTNNTIERLNREIKRRTRAIGAFPNGQSALMLVCARLRHVAGTQWGTKRYMNMKHLKELDLQNQSDIIAD